jgi:hypothetical protein
MLDSFAKTVSKEIVWVFYQIPDCSSAASDVYTVEWNKNIPCAMNIVMVPEY